MILRRRVLRAGSGAVETTVMMMDLTAAFLLVAMARVGSRSQDSVVKKKGPIRLHAFLLPSRIPKTN